MMSEDLKILLVDDFSSMRRVIRGLLKQSGYDNIVEAEDGQVAYRMLKSQDIDLIISDWNMPKMTGYELLVAVRSDPKLSGIPFLMVTAESLRDNVIMAAKAGVNNYIIKPFSAEVLGDKIGQILKESD